MFRRLTGLTLVVALMLVPAVGRAVRRIDPINAKPSLSAPFRSVDVRLTPILIAPDTSAVVRTDADRDTATQHLELADATTLPAAPDVSDRGTLRGPPLG